MAELPWASPEAIGRLTMPQIACLMSEKPPGKAVCKTAAEYLAAVERIEQEESRWDE